MQRQEDGYSRLKRVILIGDHHQLPPVVKNMAFQKYSHLDQSLFTRFIRLGTPYIQLNSQVYLLLPSGLSAVLESAHAFAQHSWIAFRGKPDVPMAIKSRLCTVTFRTGVLI